MAPGDAGGVPARFRTGHRRRVRDGRQQHGTRRRRIARMDRESSREGEGLGTARALFRGDSGKASARTTTSPCAIHASRLLNGGRQAMMARIIRSSDGIAAGAPSMFYPDLLFWLLWTGGGGSGSWQTAGAERRQARADHQAHPRQMRPWTASSTVRSPTRARVPSTSIRSGRRATTRSPHGLAVVKAMAAARAPSQECSATRASSARADWIPLFADNGG